MLLPLEQFRLRNLKSIRDSGEIEFSPLTVFIGGNGSGKSSLIEGLETIYELTESDVDQVFSQPRWRSFDNVWNKAVDHNEGKRTLESGLRLRENPMAFDLRTHSDGAGFRYRGEITRASGGESGILISEESIVRGGRSTIAKRDETGHVSQPAADVKKPFKYRLDAGESLLATGMFPDIHRWQFLRLEPGNMGQPSARRQTIGASKLLPDGSNLADYLTNILMKDTTAFNRLVESLLLILDYGRDFKVETLSKLDERVYFKLNEGDFEIPGWMLSTGSVRLVAILACLYHPEPPPVLFIEELENGLDPRTLGYVVEQIRQVVQSGATQVVATTHSPHFLNLLTLDHLVLVKRDTDGSPRFWRPKTSDQLQKWAKKFAPGQLYERGTIIQQFPEA